MLLGSASIKVVCRTLMKLSPSVEEVLHVKCSRIHWILIFLGIIFLFFVFIFYINPFSLTTLSRLCRSLTVKDMDRMRAPPGVNFIKILHEAFTCADPKSTKRDTDNSTEFLCF